MVFLERRSLFILITFVGNKHPGMQVLSMMTLTLLYVCYIGHMHLHETSWLRRVETFNEGILLGICYHFILFADPVVWAQENLTD